jgi:protein phosphatase 4 regulatory subunit 3
MDGFSNPVILPPPDLSNLGEIDQIMRAANNSPQGRDSLAKFLLSDDYIRKLVPLVEQAEQQRALPELHCLSNIMKLLILLNDTQIVDTVVSDSIVFGVVGALECKHVLELMVRDELTIYIYRRPRIPQPQSKPSTIS